MAGRNGRTSRRRLRHGNRLGWTDNRPIFDMLRWMAANGYKSDSNMKPFTFDKTGRGLMLVQAKLDPNDVIVRIPQQLLITRHAAKQLLLSAGHRETDLDQMSCLETLALCLWLEWRKQADSFYFSYIRTLPGTFDLPCYSLQDEDYIKLPSSFSAELLKEKCSFLASFAKLHQIEPDVEFEQFKWIWGAVNTRCIYVETINGESEAALAPFLDLLNHDPSARTCAKFDVINRCYIIRTLKPYRRYQQVFINYGHHCNRQLLIHYGFMIPGNPIIHLPVSHDHLQQIVEKSILELAIKILIDANLINSDQVKFLISGDGLEWKLDCLIKVIDQLITKSTPVSLIKSMLFNGKLLPSNSSRQLTNNLIKVLLSEYLLAYRSTNGLINRLLDDEVEFLRSLLIVIN